MEIKKGGSMLSGLLPEFSLGSVWKGLVVGGNLTEGSLTEST